MSVKIRISYTEKDELAGVIRLLAPALKTYKVSGKREGKYRNAYADLRPGFQNDEPKEGAEGGCRGTPGMLRNDKVYCSTYVGKGWSKNHVYTGIEPQKTGDSKSNVTNH